MYRFSDIIIILLLCCSSVFWKCVHTVPVVPFKPNGSDILWMCYSFLLLIMSEIYPQTKNAIKVYTKHERVPSLDPVQHFEFPASYILGRISFFRARRPYLTKCGSLKLTPQKENCKISNNFLFLVILIILIQVTAAPVVIDVFSHSVNEVWFIS